MRDTSLLQQALGLAQPWAVSRSDFDPEAHRLDIEIDFAPGSRFACPTCGAVDCPAYDTELNGAAPPPASFSTRPICMPRAPASAATSAASRQ